MSGIDWARIKCEYITTQTSYRKLADKYNIKFDGLAARAKKENWVGLRAQHIDNITKTVLQNDAKDKSKKLEKLKEACEMLEDIIIKTAKNCPANADSTNQLSQALSRAIGIRRNLWGILTVQEKETIDIAREKLEIDKKKNTDKNTDKDITVKLGDAEEYAE